MKTAISIPQELFLAVNELTERLNLSRSKFITTAIQDYVVRQRNRELFEALNEAYSETDTKEESDIRMYGKSSYSGLLEEEKW